MAAELSEVMIFLRYAERFMGKSVLDLGVGAGRTTRYLLPFAREYVGVDLSRAMLRRCAQTFPNARFELADVRDLEPILGSQQFDFVLASFNLLDGFSQADRLGLLRTIGDRMVPGGLFVFSSHNRAWAVGRRGPTLGRSRNPLTQLRLLVQHRRDVRNYRGTCVHEEEHSEYAFLTDIIWQWTTLMYYIGRNEQEAQIRDAGMKVLSVVDHEGVILGPEDASATSSQLYYVCEVVGAEEHPSSVV